MDIPIFSNFIEGLKLFFSSKRLRWLTLLFFIGAVTITIVERIAYWTFIIDRVAIIIGAIFPTFFMITAFLSLLGLARFVADDESYSKSLTYTIVWTIVSVVVLVLMTVFTPALLNFLFIGVAFLGWIGFQSFFSTRTALGFAESVDIENRSALVRYLYMIIYFFNYVVIVGALIFTSIFVNPAIFLTATWWFAVLGMLLAMGFNFLNGWILNSERNRSTASNISILGLFISLYSAYFIYNLLKGFDASFDLVGIGITVFFILFTMSSVGRTLASRAELDTRWKLSKEFAATFTFFLATGFMFVDALFTYMVADAGALALAGAAGDIVKLIVFPFVALLMALNFIRKSRKVLDIEDTPIEIPEMYEDQPPVSEDEPAVLDESVEEEDTLPAPEEDASEELQDIAVEETTTDESFEESE
ncbi:MAG: hypothetical protein E3J86_07355 [Candidatus Thorarchaeota archaeon]|nr:MAG: hypothetical protein E3J86_07355 [Candidatus Thorarchaeota archaeon]